MYIKFSLLVIRDTYYFRTLSNIWQNKHIHSMMFIHFIFLGVMNTFTRFRLNNNTYMFHTTYFENYYDYLTTITDVSTFAVKWWIYILLVSYS